MKKYLYFDDRNVLSMIADGKVVADKFTLKEMNLTQAQVDEIHAAELVVLKDNKLDIHSAKEPEIEKKKKLDALKAKIDTEGLKKEHIKELINNLL